MLNRDLQRVKIHQVIESQLPSFVVNENPLFVDFLKQYYISQDYTGSVVDLCENIDRFINLENFDGNSFSDTSTTLTADIDYADSTIEVESTSSWPKSYGLLKINNEIITYTSKDDTHFYGAVRGFSGIESFHKEISPNELVFSATESDSHISGDTVQNLSNIIFVEIWKKLKYQFLPGFENNELFSGIDKAAFLSRANDFYRTKGTPEALDILFKSLYGESDLKVIKPSESLIKPSDASWNVADTLVVEGISGDVNAIDGFPITQQNPYAYGNVYISTLISVGESSYYQIVLSNESKVGKFKACPTTKVTSAALSTDNSITVDSTIGFDEIGELLINGNYISYNGKSSTQFLNCVLIDDIELYSTVRQNYFVVSYENGDLTKPVYMRVSAVISNTDDILNNARYMVVGDEINVRTIGEDIGANFEIYNNRAENWLYNINYELELVNSPGGITKTTSPAIINTKIPHNFRLNDSVTLIDVDIFDTFTNSPITGRVIQILSPTSFIFEFFSGQLFENLEYVVRKNIKFYQFSDNKYVTDIQNTYVDKNREYLYVSTSSIPSYITSEIDYKKYFSVTNQSDLISTVNKFGQPVNHNFYTGDKVYFNYSGENIGIDTGTYFVKKVSDQTLKLAYNLAKIYQNDYIILSSVGISSYSNTLSLSNLKDKVVTDQKLLKRVKINPESKISSFRLKDKSLEVPVGIFLNGTEIVYSKSPDKIYYGQLTKINVNSKGRGYDIINRPNVIIDDSEVGYGASAIAHITGGLHEIKLTNKGYDYLDAPTIKISGGNGRNAVAEAIMKDELTVINFIGSQIGVNTSSNTIGFTTFHNLLSGEEVIYKCYNNAAIGIGTSGTPAAGESDTKRFLVDSARYFAIKVDDFRIKLSEKYTDASLGINELNLTQTSKGNHTLISTKRRKVVDRIAIINSGENYSNKKIIINSVLYPKEIVDKQNALVGINTHESYIYAKNHGFSSGDLVTYSTNGSSISGLSTTQNYYVIKLDNDRIRLASAGIGTTLSDSNYKNNNYTKLYGKGSGEHIFEFPPIVVEIKGTPRSPGVSGISTDNPANQISAQASGIPVFLGEVSNIFLYSGGSNYGSPQILNHNRTPVVTLNSGSGAILVPIILNGGIVEVRVIKKGSGYVAPPELIVTGSGSYASLEPVILNGQIVSVKILDSGKDYLLSDTEITIKTKGNGASLSADIQNWQLNVYEKYKNIIEDELIKSDSFASNSFDKNIDTVQLVSPTAPRKLRYLLGDNLTENLTPSQNITHSPILGWAYDGNPIYGCFGSSSPDKLENIKRMASGYEKILKPNRPPDYNLGFFINDYEYVSGGDLDEYNGRFCVTPEFPNGTYAYFVTIDIQNNKEVPVYPYVIYDFFGEPDLYNYDTTNSQTSKTFDEYNLIRNSTPYNINEQFSYYGGINLNYSKNAKSLVRSIYKTGIDSIDVKDGGQNYKVDDRLIFDNTSTNGRGLSAAVSEVVGKGVSFVSYTKQFLDNIEFIESGNLIIGIASTAHNLSNNQIITITGINTSSYKFIEGIHTVSVSTSFTELSLGIGLTASTGITTAIRLSEPTSSGKINVNDVLQIDSEKVLVLQVNKSNNTYKILRGYNSTLAGIHTAGASVELIPRTFSFRTPSGIRTNSSTELNTIKYFNPQVEVGIGTTATIKYVGIGVTFVPIGIQTGQGSYTKISFYRHSFKIGDIIELSGATNIGISSAIVVSTTATSITVDYNSSSVSSVGIGTTTIVKQRAYNKIEPQNIYMPGHGYNSGQKLKYYPISGVGLTCSKNPSLTPEFTLQNGDIVYIVKTDNDNFGISTTFVGIGSTSKLYFKDISNSTGESHGLETTNLNPIGEFTTIKGTLTTFNEHNLKVSDDFTFKITPNLIESVTLKFDDSSARLIANPISVASTYFSVSKDVISISNHSFKTGDKIVYSAASSASPLISGEEYFVIKVDNNNIKLAQYYNDAINLNYNSIGFTTTGSGNHTLGLINPPLKFIRGNTVNFNVSDSSMKNLVLDFYLDSSFTTKIAQKDITRIGSPGDQSATTSVQLKLSEEIPNVFYYKLTPVGISSITNNAIAYNVDYDVISNSRIEVETSGYDSSYSVISVGNTTIEFNLPKVPEVSTYNLSGISTFYYYTSSKTALGPIKSISIGFTGTGYQTLPGITTITTESGFGAVVSPVSEKIGSIKNISILNSGYDFPTDPTLAPKADVPFTVRLSNNYELDQIVVTFGGKNYLVPPKIISPDHPELKFTTVIEGSILTGASIDVNKTGLSEIPPRLLCVNNSNGVSISNATSDGQTNTLEILPKSGNYIEFPFKVGDEIFVEGVKLLNPSSQDTGYNSEDYNYRTFTVTSINDASGFESISYSIVGYGITGGYFDADNSVGRVIKNEEIAKVTSTMRKSDFIENEIIYNDGDIFKVQKNGWNKEKSILKLSGNETFLDIGTIVVGNSSNSKGTIEEITLTESSYKVDGECKKELGWLTQTGFLNNTDQRIHDSEYYQYFSYAINSKIYKEDWTDPVLSLAHPSGFKVFGDLILNSVPSTGIGRSNNLAVRIDNLSDLTIAIENTLSFDTVQNFDTSYEVTTNDNTSKTVGFLTKKLINFSVCKTNKVLKIDDISSQFNGTSIGTDAKGGRIVGLSTFRLTSKGLGVLSNYFIAQNVCGVGGSVVNLPGHNFSTGEEAIYDAGAGGTRIAIASTNRVLGGITTDFLPERVFIYKVDNNRFKISGIKTDAVANGHYLTFRDLGGGLGVGAGSSHSLSVPSDLANARSLITIDNIIQSPLHKKKISTSLSSSVSVGDTTITLTGITSISANLLFRIDNEILKIGVVGLGSTNVISVVRGSMGTVAAAHTVGAAVTVLGGDYNISKGYIHFTTPPYGKVGPVGLTTGSTFAGRAFYRFNYDNAYIFDDISNQFNGSNTEYELSSYNNDVTGIVTNVGNNVLGPNYGIILINNILQKPVIDYSMKERAAIGIGASIQFTGTDVLSLPKGGYINEVLAGLGSGYQPLTRAFAIPVISGAGTVQSLILQSSGSGYRSNSGVEILGMVGSGASIVALVGTGNSVGLITGFNIISGGSGYASTNPPTISVGVPTAYSNLTLIGGSGSGGKIDITVGVGGSVTEFEITNRGLGYKPNDVLTISGVPTAVGVGTSAFNITIKNIITDKFSGWSFGNLTLLDDISSQFNGRSRSFVITITDIITERYNISALPGSGINPEETLIIILNDVLQSPGENYSLVGGERIVFTTPPPVGSKCLIFFYKASPADVDDIDSLKQVKIGDSLVLNKKDQYVEQLKRVVTEISSLTETRTTNYIDVGINTDPTFYRTLNHTKQRTDLIVNNSYVSKARIPLEGRISPVSRIIKPVSTSDIVIFVENAFPIFRQLDNLPQIKNSVNLIDEKQTVSARVNAVVSAAGTITDFTILSGGENYSTAPEITISTTKPILPQYGKTWVSGTIESATVENYNDFDFGNGIFVACRNVGGISTSLNFTIWDNQTTISAQDLNSISYGNGSWVIVGNGATIFSSLNATSWTGVGTFFSRVYAGGIIPFEYPTASYTGNLNSVTYGNNKFIAVGAGGSALVSEVYSGISTSWVVRSTPSSNELNSVIFGVDNYVAVGNGGYITRSSDGFVWSSQVSGTSNNLTSVKYLNGIHFAVGDSATLIKSTDGGGIWTYNSTLSQYAAYDLFDIIYKNGVYLISGSNGLVLVSSDGDNWIRTTNSSGNINSLGTDTFRIIGVGQTAKYSVTDSEVVKATATTVISAGGTVQSISIVEPGFGYNESVGVNVLVAPQPLYFERLDNVNATGDFGTIVGIATSATGISTTSPMIILQFDCDEALSSTSYGSITRSGIQTGYYYVLSQTYVGSGVTSIDASNGFNVLGIGSTFIDNVYRADHLVSDVNSGIVTVYSNVISVSGIAQTSQNRCGYYSWGRLTFNSRQEPKQFTLSNTGLLGISTAPIIVRLRPLLESY